MADNGADETLLCMRREEWPSLDDLNFLPS